ncbi:hypothetical protein GCM10009117_19540 [Gangjinia marincola]|uniref:Outer membrane protein beta-barrel domain-containing protein n=1 Tax=Gangjinia marincola TaxID=578463 RepID=A0ABN1MHZ5_9FLAO
MSSKKHIDRVFQEAFKEFEETPPASNWNAISNRLHHKKKRRVLALPLWYKLGGAAAVLALLTWSVLSYFYQESPTNQIVDEKKVTPFPSNKEEIFSVSPKDSETEATSKEASSSAITTSAVEKDKFLNDNNTSLGKKSIISSSYTKVTKASQKEASNVASSTQENTSSQAIDTQQNSQKYTRENSFSVPLEKNEQEQATSIRIAQAEMNTKKDENSNTASSEKISLIEEAQKIAEAEEIVALSNTSTKRWEVKPMAAPVFYGGVGDGNAIDTRFSDNSTSSDITLAYGVNIGYAINDKLQVRTGVNQVSLSYNTQDISFNPSVGAVSLDNVTNVNAARNIEIHDGIPSTPNAMAFGEIQNRVIEPIPGSINQTLGYIEVPVELSYKLIDRKVGVNLIGGGSTLFLNDNAIGIDSEFGRTTIGEANNLNEVSFSTNVGLGLDYELMKNFKLNLEPVFKYQINAYSENPGNFRPYFFGVYSGFSFKF